MHFILANTTFNALIICIKEKHLTKASKLVVNTINKKPQQIPAKQLTIHPANNLEMEKKKTYLRNWISSMERGILRNWYSAEGMVQYIHINPNENIQKMLSAATNSNCVRRNLISPVLLSDFSSQFSELEPLEAAIVKVEQMQERFVPRPPQCHCFPFTIYIVEKV